jgi:hypothetical protein
MGSISPRPGSIADNRDAILGALKDQYAVEGEMTLRRCWYVLLSKQLVREHPDPKSQSQRNAPYRRLSQLLLNARISGGLPWEVIVDRTRRLDKPLTWGDVDEAVNYILETFHYDPMGEQERYVEVWVEKDAVSTRIYQTAKQFFVPVITARGFSSGTYLHDGAERFNRIPGERHVTVIYLSDFDPEGEYFPQLFKDQIGKRYGCARSVEIEKLALTRKQIDTLGLPWIPLIAQASHLLKSYVSRYVGDNSKRKVELDALDNVTLASLLRTRLGDLVDTRAIADSQSKSKMAVKDWRARYGFLEGPS